MTEPIGNTLKPQLTLDDLKTHRWWTVLIDAADKWWETKYMPPMERHFDWFKNIDAATDWVDDLRRWCNDKDDHGNPLNVHPSENWVALIIDGSKQPPVMVKAHGLYGVQPSIAWTKAVAKVFLKYGLGWDSDDVQAATPEAEAPAPVETQVRKRSRKPAEAPETPSTAVAAAGRGKVARKAQQAAEPVVETPVKAAPAARKLTAAEIKAKKLQALGEVLADADAGTVEDIGKAAVKRHAIKARKQVAS